MKESFFLSQRLGFTNAQAATIERVGIRQFLNLSLAAAPTLPEPDFLAGSPRTRDELRNIRQMNQPEKAKFALTERRRALGLAHLWLEKMHTDEFPLREKMVLFWHNHFVSDIQKVKISYAMWRQNQLFREMAFGNYRELTRRILYDNAMLAYLDNTQNKANKLNENLSRELLELFTLGVGNYTETDIKEGARALAGLSIGDQGGQYYRAFEDKGTKTYLGKTGNWKADDMVELIFAHPKAGELLATKFLKYFVTDNPSATLIADYTAAFRKADFEMKPLFEKMVQDDRFIESQGQKIKDPVTYLLQLLYEFQLEVPPLPATQLYCNGQGMKLLNPPNVKGWDGGRSWLSSQKLLQRVEVVSLLANGKSFGKTKAGQKMETMSDEMKAMVPPQNEKRSKPELRWDKSLTKNKAIIQELTDRNLFAVSPDLQNACEQLLKYDFDPKSSTANLSVTRLAEHILKSPEFQIY
jgi:uncharacterized protein (DUF1800 family)